MSDRPVPALDLIWRQALRTAEPLPSAFDLLDWAPRLRAHGEVLRDCASLLNGFPQVAPLPRQGAWTVDIARAELAELARGRRLSLNPPAQPRPSGRPDNPLGIGPGIPAREPPADPAELAGRLVRLLTADAPDASALADAFEDALELARRLPTFDYRDHAEASPDHLAAAIATAALADFAMEIRDLAVAPIGSPELLWRVARLDLKGLGPWFRNVANVIRSSEDLADLARFAASGEEEDEWSAWMALLSRKLPDWLFRHVADDLADHGRILALDAMLTRAVSRRPATMDLPTIMYLRDAALDLRAHRLAARAQEAVCAARPESILEMEILATIYADGGELAQAHGQLKKALMLSPAHVGLKARVETLGTPAFAQFSITHGFGSPSDRLETRLALRGALPDYPRAKGQRLSAVEV